MVCCFLKYIITSLILQSTTYCVWCYLHKIKGTLPKCHHSNLKYVYVHIPFHAVLIVWGYEDDCIF